MAQNWWETEPVVDAQNWWETEPVADNSTAERARISGYAKTLPKQEDMPTFAGDIARGVGSGTADVLLNFVNSALLGLPGQAATLGDYIGSGEGRDYAQSRQRVKNVVGDSALGQLAGAIPSGAGLAAAAPRVFGAAPAGAGVMRKLAQALTSGAAQGAAQSAGQQDWNEPGSAIGSTTGSAALGGLLGFGAQGVASGIGARQQIKDMAKAGVTKAQSAATDVLSRIRGRGNLEKALSEAQRFSPPSGVQPSLHTNLTLSGAAPEYVDAMRGEISRTLSYPGVKSQLAPALKEQAIAAEVPLAASVRRFAGEQADTPFAVPEQIEAAKGGALKEAQKQLSGRGERIFEKVPKDRIPLGRNTELTDNFVQAQRLREAGGPEELARKVASAKNKVMAARLELENVLPSLNRTVETARVAKNSAALKNADYLRAQVSQLLGMSDDITAEKVEKLLAQADAIDSSIAPSDYGAEAASVKRRLAGLKESLSRWKELHSASKYRGPAFADETLSALANEVSGGVDELANAVTPEGIQPEFLRKMRAAAIKKIEDARAAQRAGVGLADTSMYEKALRQLDEIMPEEMRVALGQYRTAAVPKNTVLESLKPTSPDQIAALQRFGALPRGGEDATRMYGQRLAAAQAEGPQALQTELAKAIGERDVLAAGAKQGLAEPDVMLGRSMAPYLLSPGGMGQVENMSRQAELAKALSGWSAQQPAMLPGGVPQQGLPRKMLDSIVNLLAGRSSIGMAGAGQAAAGQAFLQPVEQEAMQIYTLLNTPDGFRQIAGVIGVQNANAARQALTQKFMGGVGLPLAGGAGAPAINAITGER